MGNDDKLEQLKGRLDLLLSMYRDELGGVPLAELLYATANGLVTMEGEHPRWLAEDGVLELPFCEAAELESNLENLLTTKVTCVQVQGDVPMLTDFPVRVKAASVTVELQGRAVQRTAAGVVIQLEDTPVEVQRALVGLPAILRSRPTRALKVDKVSARFPTFVDPQTAADELFPPLPEQPEVEPSGFTVQRTIVDAPSVASFARIPEPAAAPDPPPPDDRDEAPPPSQPLEERVRTSRLKLHVPKVEATAERIGKRNHFDFLGVHFSSSLQDVAEARDQMLALIAQCREDDVEGGLTVSLDRLVARLQEAWTALQTQPERQRHRLEHVGRFQIETAIEMYDGQADAAKLTGRPEIAIDCYRRILELQPKNRKARNGLLALQDYIE